MRRYQLWCSRFSTVSNIREMIESSQIPRNQKFWFKHHSSPKRFGRSAGRVLGTWDSKKPGFQNKRPSLILSTHSLRSSMFLCWYICISSGVLVLRLAWILGILWILKDRSSKIIFDMFFLKRFCELILISEDILIWGSFPGQVIADSDQKVPLFLSSSSISATFSIWVKWFARKWRGAKTPISR
jgi:hypothetical protein